MNRPASKPQPRSKTPRIVAMFRRSTAKQLRAESKRLAKRAAELSAAADAVEARKRENSS